MSLIHENPNFPKFIKSLLIKAELSNKYIDLLTDEKCIHEFTRAFTHKSISLINNYEYYEILGDATTNKITVWYYHRRFPDLFNNPGEGNMGPVAIMARLKMVGVSKKTYATFANNLGFWDYIRLNDTKKSRSSLLEDTFESFVGCLEYLIDMKIMDYSGYGIAYIFMSKIMDKVVIKLTREELYDKKSLLNEEISKFKGSLSIEYQSEDVSKRDPSFLDDKANIPRRFETKVVITDKRNGKVYRSQTGYGANKGFADQAAAKNVLESKFLETL